MLTDLSRAELDRIAESDFPDPDELEDPNDPYSPYRKTKPWFRKGWPTQRFLRWYAWVGLTVAGIGIVYRLTEAWLNGAFAWPQ